jgi:hypothetical protein
MITELTPEISAKLKAPFDNVSWRVQSKKNANPQGRVRVVAYIDARDVMERLDDVVGPDNWSFDWTPVCIVNGEVVVAKGSLTVCGITRSDVGEAGDIEKSKASISDSLKRSAVHFGIARHLYDLGAQYAAIDSNGNILPQEKARLNDLLIARINGTMPPKAPPVPRPAQPTQQQQKPPVQLSDAVLKARANAKEKAKKFGISWETIEKTASFEKYHVNINTLDGINKILAWLNTAGMAVGIWRWQEHITEPQYAAYKKANNRTNEQVYQDLQVSAEQRGDILAAMKGVAA